MTPNIGVTCNVEVVRYGGSGQARGDGAVHVRAAIARAGARPLLLAPTPADLEDPSAARPARRPAHHRRFGPRSRRLRRGGASRDRAELRRPRRLRAAPVRAAAERDLPCLGICRGMQVVNVAYGGALSTPPRPARRGHPPRARRHVLRHASRRPGSLAAVAAGAGVAVKSYHHQGVARVGEGLRAPAWAEGDRTVEASRTQAPLRARRALASGGGRGRPADRRVRPRVPGGRRGAGVVGLL